MALQTEAPRVHIMSSLLHNTVQSIISRIAKVDGDNYELEELVEHPSK